MRTLEIAYRGYAEYISPQTKNLHARKQSAGTADERLPAYALVFDTETTTDTEQRLNFGVYRYLRRDRKTYDCVEEGLFYADDVPVRDADGYAILQGYARKHHIKLLARAAFISEVFLPAAWKSRATVVGFNLPFDISRIALDWGEARGEYRGGFTFYLKLHNGEPDRFTPAIRIKNLSSAQSLIAFSAPARIDTRKQPKPHNGAFLDLRTLAFALTSRKHSLASACEAFGLTPKQHPAQHGSITNAYIDYARNDGAITAQLFQALLDEYMTHPIAARG